LEVKMGDCFYYLLAEFPSEKRAERFLPVFRGFLDEQAECASEWQRIRKEYNRPPRERYLELRRRFPRAVAWVRFGPFERKDSVDDDGPMNLLAGHLFEPLDDYELQRDRELLRLKARVWHLSLWSHLVEFCVLGGRARAQWVSEEDVEGVYGRDFDDETVFAELLDDLVDLRGVVAYWLEHARPWRNQSPFDGFRPPRRREIVGETLKYLEHNQNAELFREAYAMMFSWKMLRLLTNEQKAWLVAGALG
jgi:hypothetical protein